MLAWSLELATHEPHEYRIEETFCNFRQVKRFVMVSKVETAFQLFLLQHKKNNEKEITWKQFSLKNTDS